MLCLRNPKPVNRISYIPPLKQVWALESALAATSTTRACGASWRKFGTAGRINIYVHQRGFEPLQQEQMILQYLEKHDRITRKEVASLCRLNPNQAYRLLHKLVTAKKLTQNGTRKAAWYVRRV